jgi:leucyl aminopeptidase
LPTFHVNTTPLADLDVDLVVVTATKGDGDDAPPVLDAAGTTLSDALGFDLLEVAAAADFDGSLGSVVRVPTRGTVPASLAVVVGLGAADEVTGDAVRRAAGAAAGAGSRSPALATSLGCVAGLDVAASSRAAVEGFTLGGYRFRTYKTDDDTARLSDVTLSVPDGDVSAAEDGVALGQVSAEATALVRDLVNTPPIDKRPPQFADRALELVADLPVEVTVLDEAALLDGGFGGHIGVGAGSTAESRFVELRYRPDGAKKHIALVGKGITFDSGGLSLKPPKAMEWMKADMAGAATVLAAVRAAAQLELPVAITGLLCLAENMPSGSATRPGDVLTIKGGQTVEVLNTDAEGRLVLADGLVHAGELDPKPDAVIDLATLTGAAIVALGPKYSGIMGDDDDLADALLAAAAAAEEPLWRLPMADKEYAEDLKSEVADIANIGGNGAGTIRAALFLQKFRPDGIPWAHLDIAGASYNDGGPYGYVQKGGSGIPARTMLEYLRAL